MGATRRPLERQGDQGDLPTLADRAEPQVVGDPHAVEEDLVERRSAGHLADRAHVDARGVHRHHEGGEARMLAHLRIGAADEQSPGRETRLPELHTFCPVTTHSSPSRTARVANPARSEPAPGSEKSWQHSCSVRSSGRTNRSCCSGVPNMAIVGATSCVVTLNVSCPAGVSYCASSSRKACS